jgi:CheY-like chemotaxis protein
VAHEVNNPLNFARNSLGTLETYVDDLRSVAQRVAELDTSSPSKLAAQLEELERKKAELGFDELADALTELVGIVNEGLQRTSRLVSDLRDFAAPHRGENLPIDVRSGLRSTIHLLGHKFRSYGAEVTLEIDEAIPAVIGDAGALNQVFLNILKNAAEAIEGGGGTIQVAAKGEGAQVLVRIRDTGPGMEAAVKARLFEPFYPPWARRTARDSMSRGSPAPRRPRDRVRPERTRQSACRRRERMEPNPLSLLDYREYPVLYVDDEPENLRIFELGFRREFSIVTANSGEAGLRILNQQPVAVVLSDQRMPGMTGVEFLTRARELDPKTIRVLVTAYGDAETLSIAINDGSIYRYVPKPWEAEDLRLTLKRSIEVYALDRERESLVRELTAVNQIAKTINQELDLGPLLDQLLGAITDELGFDAAAVLFLDDGRKTSGSIGSSRSTSR